MNFKKELIKTARILEEKGYLTALEGNLSIVDREAGLMYITPTGQRKSTLTENMVCVMDLETDKQIEGTHEPSSEYQLHKIALASRPDCTVALHSHCTYLTAYAWQNREIDMGRNNNVALMLGVIPCIPYGVPGTPDIAVGLPEKLQNNDICLLGNHGVINVGENLLRTSGMLEMVEEAVKTYMISLTFGTPTDIPREKGDQLLEILKKRS